MKEAANRDGFAPASSLAGRRQQLQKNLCWLEAVQPTNSKVARASFSRLNFKHGKLQDGAQGRGRYPDPLAKFYDCR
jgi:hypothetical protein